jgi:hypothetical protein
VLIIFNDGAFAISKSAHYRISTLTFARVERFELPSTVLETAILPLNYTRKKAKSYSALAKQLLEYVANIIILCKASLLIAKAYSVSAYFKISVTCPAPTVRPPSRIANFKPFSIAIGWINFTVKLVLSPGIIISVPAGNSTSPVTSVVRK